MKTFKSSQESGRSMIEMLGVLAIIGVLSVGGIAGYSMAMAKFKTTKTIDQIQAMTTNMRSLLESQRKWPTITTPGQWFSLGVLTEETHVDGKGVNAFGGGISIVTGTAAERDMIITYTALPQDVCIKLASTDWGGADSGLFGITLNAGTEATWAAKTLPIDALDALTGCSDKTNNTIKWRYK